MNILLVGTNRGGHLSLIGLGHRVTLLALASASEREDLARGYADIVFLEQGAPDAAFLAVAAALHGVRPFDAVHSFHDRWQASAAAIGASLGLRCLIKPAATRATLDKAHMRQLANAARVSSIDWTMVADAAALQPAAARLGYPLVAKPLEGTGSLGVTLVRTEADLERLGEAGYPLLLENVIPGEEFSVEAFSEGGRHRVIAITEKFKARESFVEIGHLVPARLPADQAARVRAWVVRLLDVLGVENGPSHTEVMLHGDAIELVESHTRTGGDEIPDLVRRACGIDMYLLEARQVGGERVLDEIAHDIDFAHHAAVWFATPALAGPKRLAAIEGLDRARALPDVVAVMPEKHPGEQVAPLRHSFDRTAHAIALHPQADRALAAARAATAMLAHRFEDAQP